NVRRQDLRKQTGRAGCLTSAPFVLPTRRNVAASGLSLKASHSAINEHDGDDNHRGREKHIQGDSFAGEEPAKKHCDYGIDVSMRGYEGRRIVFEEPIVGGKRYNRAENDEIGERKPGARGNGHEGKSAIFADGRASEE